MTRISRIVTTLSAVGAVFSAQLREYNLTLEAKWISLDGNSRPVLTINGQTPGPVIEGEEGDTLRITVTNNMFIEATMHYHGVFQVDKYWNDGVPGVTQWPIEPRNKYTYEFTLTNQTGIYFYHGHFGPAFADGQRGPLWIRPKASRPRPYEQISSSEHDVQAMLDAESQPHHLMVSDWNYEGMEILTVMYRDAGITPSCAASLVTNGRGRITCLDPDFINQHDEHGPRDSLACLVPKRGVEFMNQRTCKNTYTDFEVIQAKEGQRYLFLNFIHPGAHHELRIAIDEHDMWLVAADGDFVVPKKVQAFNLNMGDRISVIVPLNQRPGDYAIRLSSLAPEQIIQGLSILRYPGQPERRDEHGVMKAPDSKPHIDIFGDLVSGGVTMDELTDLAPFPSRSPPTASDITLRFLANMTGPSTWVLASEPHQGFRQQMPPILWNKESHGPTTFSGLKNGSVVDLIYENGAYAMHPFHKHNHKAFIIGHGTGYFKWHDVATALKEAPENFNMIDPPLRDGARLAAGPGSWTVIRYTITFPAMSMLHCHRIAHFAGGQQIVLIEGGDVMPPAPDYIKHLTHSEFVPPLRYGPLD